MTVLGDRARVLNALRKVRSVRAEQNRLDALADGAFARYFARRQSGEPTNGAAWQRAQNRAAYHSTELECAEIDAYRALDAIGWDSDLDAALSTPNGELTK